MLTLLYRLAEWHALAKLRMHMESTLTLMELVTAVLGHELQKFRNGMCQSYNMVELQKEADCHDSPLLFSLLPPFPSSLSILFLLFALFPYLISSNLFLILIIPYPLSFLLPPSIRFYRMLSHSFHGSPSCLPSSSLV
jgi:hypothetical protein